MLYAIQRGDDGPIKLGLARDPTTRLGSLQTAHDEQLFLRATWEGELRDERALHTRFAASRLRGEWFGLTPDVKAFVDSRRETYEQQVDDVLAAKAPVDDARATQADAAAARVVRARERRPRTRISHARHAGHARRAAIEGPRHAPADLLSRGKSCGAEEWFAIFCDLVPTVEIESLLIYVELIAGADRDGRVKVNVDRLSTRVLGDIDRAAIASRVYDLRDIQLPEDESPYFMGRRSWLVESLCVYHPPDAPTRGAPDHPFAWLREPVPESTRLIDHMIVNGAAEMCFVSFGAGFGAVAIPASYARGGELAARREWAQRMLDGAHDRAHDIDAA